MGIEQGYEIFNELFINTYIFDIKWFISLFLVFLTLLLLTRDVNKWKELAFPVMVCWQIIGLPTFILFYLIAIIMFILETLSIKSIYALTTGRSWVLNKDHSFEKMTFSKAKSTLSNIKDKYFKNSLQKRMEYHDLLKRAGKK